MSGHLHRLTWGTAKGLSLVDVRDWQSGNLLYMRGKEFLPGASLHEPASWPSIQGPIQLRTMTPLVSKHRGAEPLLPALRTRIGRLRQQYGDSGTLPHSESLWRCKTLEQQPIEIDLGSEKRAVKGIHAVFHVDSVTAEGADLLGAGLWLHAGGQTGFGFGRYGTTG